MQILSDARLWQTMIYVVEVDVATNVREKNQQVGNGREYTIRQQQVGTEGDRGARMARRDGCEVADGRCMRETAFYSTRL